MCVCGSWRGEACVEAAASMMRCPQREALGDSLTARLRAFSPGELAEVSQR